MRARLQRPMLKSNMMKRQKKLLERTGMRMLRWIFGVSLKDRKGNEVIRKTQGVSRITDKIRGARLRWDGHVMRREDENSMKRAMTAEVKGRHSWGKTWYTKTWSISDWRKKTLVTERSAEEWSMWLTPPMGGINSSLKEIFVRYWWLMT